MQQYSRWLDLTCDDAEHYSRSASRIEQDCSLPQVQMDTDTGTSQASQHRTHDTPSMHEQQSALVLHGVKCGTDQVPLAGSACRGECFQRRVAQALITAANCLTYSFAAVAAVTTCHA
jgi:hypothetical protein